MTRPIIGITVDNKDDTAASGQYQQSIHYSRCVAKAGGVPLLLPHEPALARTYVAMCDGVILTGGMDPVTEAFGEPTHPKARRIDPQRQAFELAMLQAIDALRENESRDMPTLGICLGMQMVALHNGGKLNQYMPDTMSEAEVHQKQRRHPVVLQVTDSVLSAPSNGGQGHGDARSLDVVSSHQQCVSDVGRLRAVATAPDGVIECIDDPSRKFYIGVQWHPERGGEGFFNQGLIDRFVAVCG